VKRKRSDDGRWNGIAREELGGREGTDIVGSKAGSEREAEGRGEAVG
jgi:hypothetical protein